MSDENEDMGQTCGNCRFFAADPRISDVEAGYCQIRSPVVVPDGNGWYFTAWPEVRSGQWCGEWASTVVPLTVVDLAMRAALDG